MRPVPFSCSLLAAALVAVVGGCAPSPARAQEPAPDAPPSQAPPKRTHPMTEHLFDLSGNEYWENPWKNAERLQLDYVLRKRMGIYVDAPDVVDPNEHSSLPMPLYNVTSGNREIKASLRDKGKLVAVKLEDRKVFVNDALPPEDKVQREPFVPSNDPLSFQESVDLHERLGLLGESGTYVIRVINVGTLSNTLTVKVERKKPTSDDPAVVEFLESQRRPKDYPPPPAPSAGLRWADAEEGVQPKPLEGSPAVPGDLGITLQAERVILLEKGAQGILKGSFRLPVLEQERVPAPETLQEGEAPTQPDYGEPRPTAMLPITLLVIGDDSGDLTFVKLAVPSWDALEGSDPVASGSFALDLLPRVGQRPQTYHVYAVCGETFVGPTLMATVTEDMLPKPGE